MIVLIDGYNVLKQLSSAVYISTVQRRAFIDRLYAYAVAHGHQIILVFDGAMAEEDYVKKTHELVVLYSGTTQDADTVLKKMCMRYKGYEAVLVSSDRDVCAYASLCGIACLDAMLFQKLLVNKGSTDARVNNTQTVITTVKSKGAAHKRAGHESSQEVDDLMQKASRTVIIKHEDGGRSREKSSHTLSKNDKKLKKLVNKL